MNKSLCKGNHYYYSYNIRLGKLIWKVIISRLPAASLLTSGGTRRQRLHEFPKWSPGFFDSPAFVLPKFGLNFSQIKAAVLLNQPLPVGLPRILHICLCILLDYIVKKILNRISSRPNSFWLTLQRWGHRGGGRLSGGIVAGQTGKFNPVSTSISDFQKEFRREIVRLHEVE